MLWQLACRSDCPPPQPPVRSWHRSLQPGRAHVRPRKIAGRGAGRGRRRRNRRCLPDPRRGRTPTSPPRFDAKRQSPSRPVCAISCWSSSCLRTSSGTVARRRPCPPSSQNSPRRSIPPPRASSRCRPPHGDNIAAPGTRTPWYAGPTLLSYLETVPIDPDRAQRGLRLYISESRDGGARECRCEGTLACGTLRRGDEVLEAVSGASEPGRADLRQRHGDRAGRRREPRLGRPCRRHHRPARRPYRRPPASPTGGRAVCRAPRLDGCGAAAPRPRVCAADRHAPDRRQRNLGEAPHRRRYAAAHRGAHAEARRDRRLRDRGGSSDPGRRLRELPAIGPLRPQRAAHRRDDRSRHRRLRAAPRRQRPHAAARP